MGQEFDMVIHPHHLDGILLEVDIEDRPVGPEEMICCLQVRDLVKLLQLVF